jgi:hypothetical protein
MEAALHLAVSWKRLTHLRDIRIGQGRLEEAAAAHRGAQQVDGGRELETPTQITAVVAPPDSGTDAEGWIRIPRGGILDRPPGVSTASATVYLVGFLSEDGSVAETVRLNGTTPWIEAARKQALSLHFETVAVGERKLSTVRLLRFVYHPDGEVEVAHSLSEQAVRQLAALSPTAIPEEMLPERSE